MTESIHPMAIESKDDSFAVYRRTRLARPHAGEDFRSSLRLRYSGSLKGVSMGCEIE